MKRLSFIRRNNQRHWVGDGFPVRSIFSYDDLGKEISPFLLLDYAGPENFPPSEQRRGVGAHPHRGFETVTIVYSGEVEHRELLGRRRHRPSRRRPMDDGGLGARARGISRFRICQARRAVRDDPAMGQSRCERQESRAWLSKHHQCPNTAGRPAVRRRHSARDRGQLPRNAGPRAYF